MHAAATTTYIFAKDQHSTHTVNSRLLLQPPSCQPEQPGQPRSLTGCSRLVCAVQAQPEVVAKTSPRLWHGTINQVGYKQQQ